MVNDELAAMVKKQYEILVAEKNVLLNNIAEIDKKLEPVIAFINAGKKKTEEQKKRGRRRKAPIESASEKV
jgi:pheromone shutdown protein TraB